MNKPMFELGVVDEDSPYCRVIPEEVTTSPVILAALTVVLFETAMNSVQEKNQISFEKQFREALDIMMRERFEYDVIRKYPEDGDYPED